MHRTQLRGRLAPIMALGLLAPLVFAFVPAHAQGTGRIGVVHLRYVLVRSQAGMAAAKRFDAYRKKLETRFRIQAKRLAQEQKMLRLKLPKESQAARERDIKAFTAGEEALRKKLITIRQELYTEHQKLFAPIEKTLLGVVRHYAAVHHYGLVMDASQAGVIIAQKGYDITSAILKAMNATAVVPAGGKG